MFEDYGLIQMLQSQVLNLIGTAVVLLVIYFIARWLVGKTEDEASRRLFKKWVPGILVAIFFITAVGFMMSAGSIAMKDIPRTGFDRGEVLEDANK